jgi:adenine-specific DNA-methyltransferase
MARRKTGSAGPVPVHAIRHEGKRASIPAADRGESPGPEMADPVRLSWERRDKSLDPQLVWRGKHERRDDLVVNAPPIYIQEQIVPQVIIENLRRANGQQQLDLFGDFDGLSGDEAAGHYQNEANWSNRMILGDSLQVMASLAGKENLRGHVQMIYIDPPYGIGFGSNWQVFTGKRDVRDGKIGDTSREVEQIKAFRDTWKGGIHSYLAYQRDRLTVARDLLTESGSVFVQISDQNSHLVRCVLDEVFGADCFVAVITFATTSSQTASAIGSIADSILWYSRNPDSLRYHQLFTEKETRATGGWAFNRVELPDGSRRPLSRAERSGDAPLPSGRRYTRDNLVSQGSTSSGTVTFDFNGQPFDPGDRSHWKPAPDGMRRLAAAGRIEVADKKIRYVRFLDDFAFQKLTNVWTDTTQAGFVDKKIYVVQTLTKVIQRCMLMATDPGDLVLDPTCGSGTTAVVAEQWGRRWITIDTSRVALALARQRVMGNRFPCYLLADPGDVRKGFVYERARHVTLKSIANNPDLKEGMNRKEIDATIARHAETEILYDRPYQDARKVRVAGPFTVESLSPHKTVSPAAPASEQGADVAGESVFVRMILDNLLTAGVQNGRKRERLEFETLSPFPGQYIQAEGDRRNGEAGTPQRVAVSIGPQSGAVNAEWIRQAARESARHTGFDLLLVCAFSFDAQAVRATGEPAPSVPVLLVRMNSDLSMEGVPLEKTGSANLFMVFGEPDVAIERTPDGIVVEIRGVDVFDPTTGEIRSNGTDEIALWMIDTNYDEKSFFVSHCYFTGNQDPYRRLREALNTDIDEAAWESLYSTRSRPFDPPATGTIAVKVINHYGDEVLQVYDV